MAAIIEPAAVAPATETGIGDSPRLAHVHLSNGLRLHYAEQGESRGQALILLHGYSDSWFSFSRVLAGLVRGRRVYALDLRGHGDSDRPATGYGMDDLGADVIAFMDARGIDRATLVGHSMGSFVAQEAALREPERVDALVLIGSATTPRRIGGIDELVAAVDALRDPVPPAFARDFQLGTIHHPIPDAFLDEAVRASLKLPARVWQAVIAGMIAAGPADRLARLGIPTLIFWGERDTIFDRSEQDALLGALPQAASRVYPDTGHALHWERPDEFIRDLNAFLLE